MAERVWKHLLLIASLSVVPACGYDDLGTPVPDESESTFGPAGPGRFLESPDPVPGQYIVVLKDHLVAPGDVPEVAQTLASQYGGTVLFTYSSALRGFAMRSSEEDARALASHPLVKYVEEDGYASPQEP